MIVARCPRCRGWTMFHGDPSSETAHTWTFLARTAGDLISTVPDDAELGPSCPASWGNPLPSRTCTPVPQDEPAWSPYP